MQNKFCGICTTFYSGIKIMKLFCLIKLLCMRTKMFYTIPAVYYKIVVHLLSIMLITAYLQRNAFAKINCGHFTSHIVSVWTLKKANSVKLFCLFRVISVHLFCSFPEISHSVQLFCPVYNYTRLSVKLFCCYTYSFS